MRAALPPTPHLTSLRRHLPGGVGEGGNPADSFDIPTNKNNITLRIRVTVPLLRRPGASTIIQPLSSPSQAAHLLRPTLGGAAADADAPFTRPCLNLPLSGQPWYDGPGNRALGGPAFAHHRPARYGSIHRPCLASTCTPTSLASYTNVVDEQESEVGRAGPLLQSSTRLRFPYRRI